MNMASLNVLTTDFDCGGVDGDTQRASGGVPCVVQALTQEFLERERACDSRFDSGPQSPIEPERLPAPEADQSPVTSDGFGFLAEARIAVLKAVAVWFVFLSALAGIELFMR